MRDLITFAKQGAPGRKHLRAVEPAKLQFWHGGPKGLRRIEPPAKTGAKSYGAIIDPTVCRRDRVYITTSYVCAVMYAASHGDGTVYLVDPEGELEMDLDCSEPGLSFAVQSARIIRECRPSGKQLKRGRKAILKGEA